MNARVRRIKPKLFKLDESREARKKLTAKLREMERTPLTPVIIERLDTVTKKC